MKSLINILFKKESQISFGFLLLFVFDLSAQNTFNKTFGFQNHREEFAELVQIGNEYFFTGGSVEENSSNNLVKLLVLKTDFNGEGVDSINFQFDSLSNGGEYNTNRIFVNSYGDIYLAGSVRDNNLNNQDGTFIKIKNNDLSVEMYRFNLDSTELFTSIFNINEKLYILGQTNSKGNGQADYYLLKTDTLGNILADTTLGGVLFEQIGNAIKVNENHYILCGQTSTYANQRQYYNVPAANAQFIAVDSNFNVLWDQVLYSPGVDFLPMIKEYGFFYYSVEHPILPPPKYRDDYVQIVGQVDVNTGALLWRDTIKIEEEIIAQRFFETVDSNSFIVFCEVEHPDYPYSFAKIIKFDKQGNILWQRSYYDGNINGCYLNTMIVDSDGYLVFGGTVANLETQSQDAWLLKLRPDGCLNNEDCGIVSGIIDLSPAQTTFGIYVYPNPASQEAYISVANTASYKNENLVLNIYDLSGKLVYTETQKLSGQLPEFRIDVRSFSSGTYLVQSCVLGKECGSTKLLVE